MAVPEGGSNDDDLDEETAELYRRLSIAFNSFNAEAHTQVSGTLIQAWQPKTAGDGSVYLQTKGLPVSIYGMGDQLAMFRYKSCQYRFSTDTSNPESMGVVGRVFTTREPEMCGDVQKYSCPTYLRSSVAAECHVHSSCFVPVFSDDQDSSPVSVVELTWHEVDVPFESMLRRLQSALKGANLHMCDVDFLTMRTGLRRLSLGDNSG